jgi:two-component system, NarL family, response regulator LiaR
MLPSSIRVLIVDDHTIVRRGIRTLLSIEGDIDVVGEAGHGGEAITLTTALQPDIVLMDLVMPQVSGIEATYRITRQQPNTRVLILTSFAAHDKLFLAFKAGAVGCLLKDATPVVLAETIRQAYNGEASLDRAIAIRILQDFSGIINQMTPAIALTRREMDVLMLLAQGHRNKAIADLLAISERTVRAHITHILQKLHLTSRTQAAMYALREGLASLDHSSHN